MFWVTRRGVPDSSEMSQVGWLPAVTHTSCGLTCEWNLPFSAWATTSAGKNNQPTRCGHSPSEQSRPFAVRRVADSVCHQRCQLSGGHWNVRARVCQRGRTSVKQLFTRARALTPSVTRGLRLRERRS